MCAPQGVRGVVHLRDVWSNRCAASPSWEGSGESGPQTMCSHCTHRHLHPPALRVLHDLGQRLVRGADEHEGRGGAALGVRAAQVEGLGRDASAAQGAGHRPLRVRVRALTCKLGVGSAMLPYPTLAVMQAHHQSAGHHQLRRRAPSTPPPAQPPLHTPWLRGQRRAAAGTARTGASGRLTALPTLCAVARADGPHPPSRPAQ